MAVVRPRVSDLMTGILETAREDETLLEVAERMAGADVGALPVCDESGRLCGIITDRDIVVRAVAAGRDPATTTVREIKTIGIKSVRSDDPIEHVAEVMALEQVRRVPVIRGEELIGMVSQADLARVLAPEHVGAIVSEISRD